MYAGTLIVPHLSVASPKPPPMKKVLIIDDAPAILEIVDFILSREGFEVFTSLTGVDIENLIGLYQPDVILLDVKLPGKSGIEVCLEIKHLSGAPVIFFSAHADKDEIMKECDASAFIKKPFDIKDLINTVRMWAN